MHLVLTIILTLHTDTSIWVDNILHINSKLVVTPIELNENFKLLFMLFLDPGIGASEKPGAYPPYDRGMEMDIFVKNSTNQPFVGKVSI